MKPRRERKIAAQFTEADGKPLPVLPGSRWWIYAALFLIALIAYADSFAAGLAQDSRVIITEDSRIR